MVTGKLFSDTSRGMQYCIFLVKFDNLILFLLFATGCTCLVNKDFDEGDQRRLRPGQPGSVSRTVGLSAVV